MTKYVRAKKYLRVSVPLLIVLGAVLVPKVEHSSKAETLGVSSRQPKSGELVVSKSGEQLYTNVTAGSLQEAKAPERSVTSASLNPQQAVPNYCASGEQPYIDGCISH